MAGAVGATAGEPTSAGSVSRTLRAAMPTAEADRQLTGLPRIRHLWTLFRNERDDPEPFYRTLAAEAIADLDRRHGVSGTRVLDLGCGPGWYTDAFRAAGATAIGVDGGAETLRAGAIGGLVQADAGRLPFDDATFHGVFCSNLLEHARDTGAIVDEIARVLRPDGWAYVSWTNWYSPHGGHDMSPWHLLGPRFGPRVYERLFGPPPTNRYGEGLFAVHIGPTVRLVREHPALDVDRVEPRYWPKLRAICSVPGAREVLTWNCVIRARRT